MEIESATVGESRTKVGVLSPARSSFVMVPRSTGAAKEIEAAKSAEEKTDNLKGTNKGRWGGGAIPNKILKFWGGREALKR